MRFYSPNCNCVDNHNALPKHRRNVCMMARTRLNCAFVFWLIARNLRLSPLSIKWHLHFYFISSVFCLFIPQVRSSDATWSDTRRNLRKDHRWESASLLEREEKEKLFNEHVEALAKKKKEHFRQLLDETSMVMIQSLFAYVLNGHI